ncbi:MAG: alanine racemase [Candidatus Peribacteraceae bacterium]|nr:alanine racemase [Candidatus Peribacteraceae bacterium]
MKSPLADAARRRLESVPALREKLLPLKKIPGEPLFVYEEAEVLSSYKKVTDAFAHEGVTLHPFFAMKSNSYAGLLKTIVSAGGGLDASSTRELAFALAAGAEQILLTGPAKTEKEFAYVVDHPGRITVNLESMRELELLGRMAKERGVKVRCGLRVVTDHQHGWTKFGQPLTQLRPFYDAAKRHASLDFSGVHFHTSFNGNPDRYVRTIQEVCAYAREHFSPEERAECTYIDMGGGLYPEDLLECTYPWNDKLERMHASAKVLQDIRADRIKPRVIPPQIIPMQDFASAVSAVYQDAVRTTFPHAELYAEPGRLLSNNSMHLLLTLIDKKEDWMGITDAGTNMIGWEKYQYFYYSPVFNLTHFSAEREVPFFLYGSLCTPDDLWGYYLHCSDVQEGDTICLPYQGAYTYALAQNFIRAIPPVVELSS